MSHHARLWAAMRPRGAVHPEPLARSARLDELAAGRSRHVDVLVERGRLAISSTRSLADRARSRTGSRRRIGATSAADGRARPDSSQVRLGCRSAGRRTLSRPRRVGTMPEDSRAGTLVGSERSRPWRTCDRLAWGALGVSAGTREPCRGTQLYRPRIASVANLRLMRPDCRSVLSMRALQLFGDRDLRLTEIDAPPPPAPGEVQMRVRAVGLNHHRRLGLPRHGLRQAQAAAQSVGRRGRRARSRRSARASTGFAPAIRSSCTAP